MKALFSLWCLQSLRAVLGGMFYGYSAISYFFTVYILYIYIPGLFVRFLMHANSVKKKKKKLIQRSQVSLKSEILNHKAKFLAVYFFTEACAFF